MQILNSLKIVWAAFAPSNKGKTMNRRGAATMTVTFQNPDGTEATFYSSLPYYENIDFAGSWHAETLLDSLVDALAPE